MTKFKFISFYNEYERFDSKLIHYLEEEKISYTIYPFKPLIIDRYQTRLDLIKYYKEGYSLLFIYPGFEEKALQWKDSLNNKIEKLYNNSDIIACFIPNSKILVEKEIIELEDIIATAAKRFEQASLRGQ